MNKRDDRKLGMRRDITRRDFLNGVAIGTGGAIADSLLPGCVWGSLNGGGDSGGAAQDKAGYYPPALTGLRGSHVGSFEAAHSLRDKGSAADGAFGVVL